MYFCTARDIRNAPLRCTFMTVSQSASVILNSMLSRVTPALLISTVGPPSSVATRSTAAETASASDTSTATASAFPPAEVICSAVPLAPASSRSSTPTANPSWASRSAVAAPMPRAAPVTMATRLVAVVMLSLLVLCAVEPARRWAGTAARSCPDRRRGFQHRSEPVADDGGGLGHDPVDELGAGRDVADEGLHHAGRPDSVVDVAGLVDLDPAHAGHQLPDVGELRALVQPAHHLAAHRVVGDPRGVAQLPEDQLCLPLLRLDQPVLDVLVDAGLHGGHPPGAHADPVGAQGQRGDQAPAVGEPAGGQHRHGELIGGGRDEHQAGDVVLAGVPGALEPVDADRVHAQRLRLDRVPHAGALVDHL